MLSREFLERVHTERTVDTRKYRYLWISETGVNGGNIDANRNHFPKH